MSAVLSRVTKKRRAFLGYGRVRRSILSTMSALAVLYVVRALWIAPSSMGHGWSLSSPRAFKIPPVSAIVPEDLEDWLVDNFPSSELRPQDQFMQIPQRTGLPVIAIGTVAKNLDERIISLTYRSLAQGSLANWTWHIVDHATTDAQSLRWLKELARQDPRIVLTRARSSVAHAAAMSQLLREMSQGGALFGVILPPYSMVEHTILEKSVWSLTSVPQWDLVGHFTANFGDARDISILGLHSGPLNLKRNLIPDTTVFRLQTTLNLGCTFDEQQVPSLLMWDFWVCFSSNNRWGGTIPELGGWHNTSTVDPGPVPLWAAKRLELRASSISESAFTHSLVTKSTALEPVGWTPAFTNGLGLQKTKGILIVQGWLLVGGSELGFLEVLRHFAVQGIRVTMVLTRMRYPDSIALRGRVAQYTNDIHSLPSFLRMSDFPRYLKYLIDSRQIDTVFMSNSQLIYEILPALAEQTPGVAYIDYVGLPSHHASHMLIPAPQLHNESFDGWKTDGFPSFALISRRYLARTLTCSEHLRKWLIQRGYPPGSVGVAKLGINITRFPYTTEEQRRLIKSEVLGFESTTLVLASSARLDSQKRPLLVPRIVEGVIARLAAAPCAQIEDVHMLMMGSGSLRETLIDIIESKGLGEKITLMGNVDAPTEVLRGSDIFLLPSAIEGISIAVAEAMAIGLPVVTTHAGALPEQLGDLGNGNAIGGRLIIPSVDESLDVQGYVDAIVELACDAPARLAIGHAAHEHVARTFDQQSTLNAFTTELEFAVPAIPRGQRIPDTPNPSAQYALQSMAMEDGLYVDLHLIQLQLSRVKQVGLAGELQAKCFVEGSYAAAWHSAVAGGLMCDGSQAQLSWLVKSAKEQCGAWCLWDL
jgi:glycosyltransferase involved in cell wall biosynthesis